MATTTALITGGAGFIGSHLVDTLLTAGQHVRVLDDLSTGSLENLRHCRSDIEFVEGDFTDATAAARSCRAVDTVYHLGALGSVPRSVADPMNTHRVNATGTLQILLAARDNGVGRFIFSSSSSVFGSNLELPKTEEMTGQPLSPYAATKSIGEDYLRQFSSLFDFDAVTVRFFNVFGPRQAANHAYAAVVPKFLDAAMRNQAVTVHGDGLQRRDFTYVDNVTAGLAALGTAPRSTTQGEVYHLACGSSTSLTDVLSTLERLLGRKIPREHTEPRAGDIRDSMASIAKIESCLGYRVIVDVEEGIERTFRWFESVTGTSQ